VLAASVLFLVVARPPRGAPLFPYTTLAAGPARAADPVHVVLGMGGDVEVEDVAYRRDVEAARGHVGRDEEAKRAVAEAVERLHALALVEVSVDRRGIEAVRLQRLREDVHFRLAVAEEDGVGAGLAFRLDDGAQKLALLLRGLVLAGRCELDQS